MGAGSPPPVVAATAAVHKIQLKSANMKEEMWQEAFEIAGVAFEKHSMEKNIAEYIKEFDKNHGPTWHCIVSCNFDLVGQCSEWIRPQQHVSGSSSDVVCDLAARSVRRADLCTRRGLLACLQEPEQQEQEEEEGHTGCIEIKILFFGCIEIEILFFYA